VPPPALLSLELAVLVRVPVGDAVFPYLCALALVLVRVPVGEPQAVAVLCLALARVVLLWEPQAVCALRLCLAVPVAPALLRLAALVAVPLAVCLFLAPGPALQSLAAPVLGLLREPRALSVFSQA
jgi:hypothetical protein